MNNFLVRGSVVVSLVFVSACATLRGPYKSPFKSALPQTDLRFIELGSVSLTQKFEMPIVRDLEKHPWQGRGRKALGPPLQSMIPPLFLGGDDALILTLGGGVGVYNVKSASPKWYKPLRIGAAAWPLVLDNFVYIAGMDERVHKLRLDNGDEVWSATLSTESTGGVSSSLGFIYVSADDSSLTALDEKTGKSQWAYKRPTPSGVAYWSLRGSAYPQLSADGSKIYAGFADGTFVCLEASSGQTLWERNFERAGLFQDADQKAQLSKDGSLLFVPLVDSDLVVLKTSDGSTLYKIPAGGGSSPLIDETEGFMYVTLNSGAIQKVDLKTTKVEWTRELATGYTGMPASIGPQAIAVVSSAEGLKVLRRKDGAVIYSYRSGPGVLAPPAFDGRRLLLLSGRNELIQFRVEERAVAAAALPVQREPNEPAKSDKPAPVALAAKDKAQSANWMETSRGLALSN